MDTASSIAERVRRHRAFLSRAVAGDTLFMQSGILPGFEGHWIKALMSEGLSDLLKPDRIDKINTQYVRELRGKLNHALRIDDDSVPTAEVYFSIGSVTAAMTGRPASFSGDTGWCEPELHDWDDLPKLVFNPDNPWLRFHVLVYRDLAAKCEGDYLMLPFIHRSPLDAANGIRGNALFTDFYDSPDMAKSLINWCAEWSIRVEDMLRSELSLPAGIARGVWSVAVPDNAVFVNGDPVDLISDEQHAEFERPFTEKLFTATGGGFFHHHALGMRQVSNVSRTRGLLVQNILTDPNVPVPVHLMLRDEGFRGQVVEASMKAPIHLTGDFSAVLEELLPVLRQGRFILRHDGPPENTNELVEKLSRNRNPL